MKLLACGKCAYIVKVQSTEPVQCMCAENVSWAKLELDDHIHVRYGGDDAAILGLFNDDLIEAILNSRHFLANWPLRVHAFPPGDGVLRQDDLYCTRCQGTTPADAWRAHTGGSSLPPGVLIQNFAAPGSV